jgi:hypothetical protein
MESDRVQLIEYFDSNSGENQVKLKVGGFLFGIFNSKNDATAFANSPEGAALAEKARALF